MTLNTPKRLDGSNHMYCGPAALCAITGWNYEDVRTFVNEDVRGRKHNQGITSMHDSEMTKTLWAMGWIAEKMNCYSLYSDAKGTKRYTLNQFLKNRREHERNCILLISVTDHYVTVEGDHLVDNHTKIPVRIEIAPWKRKRVTGVWFVRPRTQNDY